MILSSLCFSFWDWGLIFDFIIAEWRLGYFMIYFLISMGVCFYRCR
jgi:hypothetical protein